MTKITDVMALQVYYQSYVNFHKFNSYST